MDSFLRPLGPRVNSTLVKDSPLELHGKHIRLCRLQPSDAEGIYNATGGLDHMWDYMFDGPFQSLTDFQESILAKSQKTDHVYYAIQSVLGPEQPCVGHIALFPTDKHGRVVQIADIFFAPSLQRTPAAAEAFYLLSCIVFDHMNFRRFEWKCDNLNGPSKRAAKRLGFRYEGLFRQHMIVKGRNRDTAWHSMLDGEWALVKEGFKNWLSPENFDERGTQRFGLKELRERASS